MNLVQWIRENVLRWPEHTEGVEQSDRAYRRLVHRSEATARYVAVLDRYLDDVIRPERRERG